MRPESRAHPGSSLSFKESALSAARVEYDIRYCTRWIKGKKLYRGVVESSRASSRATSKREDALSTLWVAHTMDADARRDMHVVHVLRRDEDVLLTIRGVRRLDLPESQLTAVEWIIEGDAPSSSCWYGGWRRPWIHRTRLEAILARAQQQTDGASYPGSGLGNQGGKTAEAIPWNNHPFSLDLTLPPLAIVFLKV